ncbi:MAG TPA: FAD-dependent oxidoreductase, partial [Microbacterium sp.]|nr:FAD-dependent oxidoreductase [Microbacterium sp.]
GVYSAHPDDIDVEIAAPGLNSAMTRAGSLSGAVGLIRGERTATPGASIEGIDGGVTRLVEALRGRLGELGAEVVTGVAVEAIEKTDGGWIVTAEGHAPERADAVVVATPEAPARRLLGRDVPELAATAPRPGPDVHVVTLVIDAPALDAHPRGTGVLTVAGARAAKALTHSTAKWPWLSARVAPGRHVVRVSFGSQGEAPATEGLSEEEAAALALAEASALLGVPLDRDRLVGSRLERYGQAQPASVRGQRAAAESARAAVHAVDGLAVTGAWLSGTGLAQVVPDAIAAAERVRQSALWG